MKEQLIQEVQRQMLPYLNNAQLKQLQGVLEGVLSGVELSHSAGMVESAKVDTVACFINAKRIEGCSEKTLSYYRQTIMSMLSGIDKEPQEIATEDLRKYLTEYQANRKSSKVTIDNIRRILSSYFSWLEDEDYIVKPGTPDPQGKNGKSDQGNLYRRGIGNHAGQLLQCPRSRYD